ETLLRVSHAEGDWPRWLEAAGVAKLAAKGSIKGPLFEYYGHALQAAVDGIGVAIGIRPYIDDDLAAGRLVAPFGLSVPKAERWYLVFREFRREEPAFRHSHSGSPRRRGNEAGRRDAGLLRRRFARAGAQPRRHRRLPRRARASGVRAGPRRRDGRRWTVGRV